MYRCKSGKHWWTDETDAQKCCNGWTRTLVVLQPGEPAPEHLESLQVIDGALTGRAWVQDKETQRELEQQEQQV